MSQCRDMMSSFSEIIDLWPDAGSFALDLNEALGTPGKVRPEAVRKWSQRNKIPDGYWAATVKASQKRKFKGVSLKVLSELAQLRAA